MYKEKYYDPICTYIFLEYDTRLWNEHYVNTIQDGSIQALLNVRRWTLEVCLEYIKYSINSIFYYANTVLFTQSGLNYKSIVL